MRRLLIALSVLALAGCDRGDIKWNDPTTNVVVSMRGCQPATTRGQNDLLVNVESNPLPDGRMQCVITTLRTNNK